MMHPVCFISLLIIILFNIHIQNTEEIKFISKAIREIWQTLTNIFICLPVESISASQYEINIRAEKQIP